MTGLEFLTFRLPGFLSSGPSIFCAKKDSSLLSKSASEVLVGVDIGKVAAGLVWFLSFTCTSLIVFFPLPRSGKSTAQARQPQYYSRQVYGWPRPALPASGPVVSSPSLA